jgi:hypothetical protein
VALHNAINDGGEKNMKKFIVISGLVMLIVMLGSVAAVAGAELKSGNLRVSASDKTVVFYITPIPTKDWEGKDVIVDYPKTNGTFYRGTYDDSLNGFTLDGTIVTLHPTKIQGADSQVKLFFDLSGLPTLPEGKDWVQTYANFTLTNNRIVLSTMGPGFAWRRR